MGNRRYVYPGVPTEPGYYVYELWAGEVCLYVGRVGNSGPQRMYSRLGQHRSSKPWFGEVTRIAVSAFSSHEEIAAEEPRRIYELRPLHNRTYAVKCSNGHVRPFGVNAEERGACPECRAGYLDSAYYREYNGQPERVASERAREAGGRRQGYYAKRNALPEVKARKTRWVRRASRRPGPGQGAMF